MNSLLKVFGFSLIIFLNGFTLSAQEMIRMEHDQVVYSNPIYKNSKTDREYTKHIIVRFRNNSILELEPQSIYGRTQFQTMEHQRSSEVNRFMEFLHTRYGIDEIQRYYRNGKLGDTLRVNVRTGRQFVIGDDTQVLLIQLHDYILIDTLIVLAKSFEESVRRIEGPDVAYLLESPNDPELPNQWPIPYMDFEAAWELVDELVESSGNVKIAISDYFRTSGSSRHEDLQLTTNGGNIIEHTNQKVYLSTSSSYHDSDHGNQVASVAGSTFNNNKGLAGYSKNAQILPFTMGAAGIQDAIYHGANIINCS